MSDSRLKKIMQASIVAIFVNVLLGIFKAIVGFITNSVAITMDAVNNFSDAASSLVTIITSYFASKSPDKKHPFGYGRYEYLGTLLIGGLISYAGVTAVIESVKQLTEKEAVEYTTVTLIIVAVAIIVKIALTVYIVNVGKKCNSESLRASGKEAIGDVAVSIATLVAAFVFMFLHISLEAWLGVIIGALIVKAGVTTLIETIDMILGKPAEVSLVKAIKKEIASHEHVKGAYDLILHNYGEDSYMASVHIAVDDSLSMKELDDTTRLIQKDVLEKFDIFLTAIGIYSVNSSDEAVLAVKKEVEAITKATEYVNQFHGFYLNTERKEMSFDIVVSFDAKDRHKVHEEVMSKMTEKYPEYSIEIGVDSDFNELD